MENLLAILRRMGAARIAMLVVATFILIALLSTVAIKSNAPDYGLMYGGLSNKESAKIIEKLEGMGVNYQVKAGGVYVSKAKIAELRLKVAGEGIVGSSTAGYELFDKQSSFGTTSLVQNINARRALEGELSRTIASLPTVSSARVHLVMPKKKLFSRERIEPTASVVVNIGTRILSDEQIQSITHLISASVPSLTPDNVTVVDNRGNMLSTGNKSQSNVMNMHQKVQRQIESEYEYSIKRMLEKVVGPNKANVKVTASIDFDSVEEESEIFDPENQVIRSEQRSEDRVTANQTSANQAAGASANIPGQEVGGGAGGSSENRTSAEETINYEISKTIRKHVKAGGAVNRLSVAVLVEGNYSNEDGVQKYAPYDSEELEKFATLVKTGIAYNEERGDLVEIIDMPFAHTTEEIIEEPLFTKEDYFMIAEYVLIGIGIFLLIFIIIKPILKATLPQHKSSIEELLAGTAGVANINTADVPGGTPLDLPVNEIAEEGSMIDLQSVEGKVRESSVKKVMKIVSENPEESINVIRGWMTGSEEGN
ncbi:MAG: flagellar M-ring protein FliF [Alphaproteobacteria bacterium]